MRLCPHCRLHRRRGRCVLMVYAAKTLALEVNESFAFLWEQLDGKDFTPADVADLLKAHYGLEAEEAAAEAKGIVELWEKEHLVTP